MTAPPPLAPPAPDRTAIESERPQAPSQGRLVLLLGAVTALGPLAIDMYLPAFPAIARELATPIGMVQLSLASYLAGAAVAQLIYGFLADRVGRRLPLLAGLVLFALGSVAVSTATSVEALIGWRAVMALGGAAGMVIARAIVRDLFSARDAARLYSLLMLVMGLAPVAAPAIGTLLLSTASWRTIFWLQAAIGVVAWLALLLWLPETLRPSHRAHARATPIHHASWMVLREGRFVAQALATGFGAGTLFVYISGVPVVLLGHYGASQTTFSLLFGATAMGIVAVSQLNRRMLRSWSSEQLLQGAFLVSCACAAALVVAGLNGAPLAIFYPLLLGTVATWGIIAPNLAALAIEPFGTLAGSASALLGTIQLIVGAGAGAVVGWLGSESPTVWAAVLLGTSLCGAGSLALSRALPKPRVPRPEQGSPRGR